MKWIQELNETVWRDPKWLQGYRLYRFTGSGQFSGIIQVFFGHGFYRKLVFSSTYHLVQHGLLETPLFAIRIQWMFCSSTTFIYGNLWSIALWIPVIPRLINHWCICTCTLARPPTKIDSGSKGRHGKAMIRLCEDIIVWIISHEYHNTKCK